MPKPPLGKVAVGDRLLVIPNTYGRGKAEPLLSAVTTAGRVWIELAEITDGHSRRWRLRLDAQDNGKDGAYRDRFLTAEQYASSASQPSATTCGNSA